MHAVDVFRHICMTLEPLQETVIDPTWLIFFFRVLSRLEE